MQIYQFGGASLKDAERIAKIADFIKNGATNNLLIVISAMGETTNALEELTQKYYNQEEGVFEILNSIKNYHFTIIDQLFKKATSPVYDDINNTFVEIEWTIEDEPQDSFDFIYDQIVSVGELLASKIISHYLDQLNISNKWLDARSFIQTDNTYRNANVDWDKTRKLIVSQIPEVVAQQIIITQGFIGNTSENFTTTLGRQSADYSAVIFADCLNAETITVWKDISTISSIKSDGTDYREIIAKNENILHSKALSLLQEKDIPLSVKLL